MPNLLLNSPADPSINPRFSRFRSKEKFFVWTTCGDGVASGFNFEQRATRLPDSPVLILAAGYRSCQQIDISLFEPRVAVASYPAGFFGDYVYQNTLVADRLEFFDETSIAQLFQLTAKSAGAVDDFWLFWFDSPTQEVSIADFRNATGFAPELLIELVGETKVRVEMDFTHEKMLVEAGDRWQSYVLDGAGAFALKDIVLAERFRRRQAGDPTVTRLPLPIAVDGPRPEAVPPRPSD